MAREVAGLAIAAEVSAVVIVEVGFAAEWCGVMCAVDSGVVVVVVAICWVAGPKNAAIDAVGLICLAATAGGSGWRGGVGCRCGSACGELV